MLKLLKDVLTVWLVLAIICLLVSWASANPHPWHLRVRTHESVCNGQTCKLRPVGFGSAVAIHSDASGTLVLTAWHNIIKDPDDNHDFVTLVKVVDTRGVEYDAEIVLADKNKDLALLRSTLAGVPTTSVARSFNEAGKYWVCGWPFTGLTGYRATIADFKRHFSSADPYPCRDCFSFFNSYAFLGQSGGAIIDENGYVAGIISVTHRAENETGGATRNALISFTRDAVAKAGYTLREAEFSYKVTPVATISPSVYPYRGGCRNGQCYRQIAPTPAPARPQPVQPRPAPQRSIVKGCDCGPKLKAINERLAALEAKAPVCGPKGEDGPQGPPGKDAPAIDIDALTLRITKSVLTQVKQAPPATAPGGRKVLIDVVPTP